MSAEQYPRPTATATALIADDEPLIRYHVKQQMEELWPEIEVVGQAENGIQALELCLETKPELIFLDIRMPGRDGLEVAKQLQQDKDFNGLIVFITADDQYAVQAFEREAIDYLLKPLEDARFEKTLLRLQQRLTQADERSKLDANLRRVLQSLSAGPDQPVQPSNLSPAQPLRWVRALRHDEVHLIDVNQIQYFHAEDKYIRVVTAEGEYLIRTPIKELEQRLDPEMFWRIHRSYIVRVPEIGFCQRDFSGRLYLHLKHTDTRLPVSRSHAHRFKQM